MATIRTTPNGPLTDPHLCRLREAVAPGVREVEVSAYELRALLDEVEQARIAPIDLGEPAARTRTLPTADTAVASYRAAVATIMADTGECIDDWNFAFGYFVGLGFTFEVARHLAIRV